MQSLVTIYSLDVTASFIDYRPALLHPPCKSWNATTVTRGVGSFQGFFFNPAVIRFHATHKLHRIHRFSYILALYTSRTSSASRREMHLSSLARSAFSTPYSKISDETVVGQTTVDVTPALCAGYRSKTSSQSTSVRSAKGGGKRNERWGDGKESVFYRESETRFKNYFAFVPARAEMERDATEKRTQPGRDTGSQPTENARTEQANETSVDLQRALHGAPVVGRNPLVSRGPQGSAPAARSRRGSPAVWTGRTTSGPRGHYCLPLLLLPLSASCAAAFWSAECNVRQACRRVTWLYGWVLFLRSRNAMLNVRAKGRIALNER